MSDTLGFISRKYETYNEDPGTISNTKGDPGGKSYGIYQLALKTGTLGNYVRQSKFEGNLTQYKLASPEFDRTWKQLAVEYPEEFREDQHNFITRTHYNPVRSNSNLPDTQAINEALYSMSVQHGRAKQIVEAAESNITEEDTEYDIIDKLYEARSEYIHDLRNRGKLNPRLAANIISRYQREHADVIKLCL